MPDFAFSLAALLQYRRHRRDLCRLMLAQVLAGERLLAVRHQELRGSHLGQLDEIRGMAGPGEVDVDRAAARRYYAGRLAGELRLLERNRELVGEQVALCRQTLLQADHDVKVLERLEEKQRAVFRRLEEQRETRDREDAWFGAHAGEFCR